MFVSFNRNQQRSPLLRLPLELRNMIYRYVLDTAIIRILPPPGDERRRAGHYFSNINLLRFLFRTPSLLFVSRQIRGEASAFQDEYIAVRITPETNHRLLFNAIRLRASRFGAVEELELPQDALDKNVYIRTLRFQYYFRLTRQDLPALETVVWTPGRIMSRRVREETEIHFQ